MSHRTSIVAVTALVATTAACAPAGEAEDPRLSQVTTGITRDSLLRILGSGSTSGDSLPNVYRREVYLAQGMPIEILFYSPDGARPGQEPAPAESTLRPVVLSANQVIGWGWTFFDSVARVNDIRAKVR